MKSKFHKALEAFIAQGRWIEEHGETLEGYIQRYGSADDPDHYGDGGEAIYNADMDEFVRLHQEFERAAAKHQGL